MRKNKSHKEVNAPAIEYETDDRKASCVVCKQSTVGFYGSLPCCFACYGDGTKSVTPLQEWLKTHRGLEVQAACEAVCRFEKTGHNTWTCRTHNALHIAFEPPEFCIATTKEGKELIERWQPKNLT